MYALMNLTICDLKNIKKNLALEKRLIYQSTFYNASLIDQLHVELYTVVKQQR